MTFPQWIYWIFRDFFYCLSSIISRQWYINTGFRDDLFSRCRHTITWTNGTLHWRIYQLFVQDCSISSQLAMEILQFCPNLSISSTGSRWYKTFTVYTSTSIAPDDHDTNWIGGYTLKYSHGKSLNNSMSSQILFLLKWPFYTNCFVLSYSINVVRVFLITIPFLDQGT